MNDRGTLTPDRLFDLHRRVALVTGGDRGLGFAMAAALAGAGATVILAARDADGLMTAATRIREESGATVHVLPADLADRTQAEALVERCVALAGRVDVLLADAGVSVPEPVSSLSDAVWDQTLAINLSATMLLTRAAVVGMTERGWGRIIYVSSTFGEVSAAGRGAYSASKAGLRGLARAAAIDLAPNGITVNCIAPGPFETDMTARTAAGTHEQFARATALGRWGQPAELAGPILLLASDAGSYITGTTLFVDGGYTAR